MCGRGGRLHPFRHDRRRHSRPRRRRPSCRAPGHRSDARPRGRASSASARPRAPARHTNSGRRAERLPADVVVVDRHLPDEDGLSLCLWLRTRTPAPAVVIYSAFADEALVLPAVVAGACALIGKVVGPGRPLRGGPRRGRRRAAPPGRVARGRRDAGRPARARRTCRSSACSATASTPDEIGATLGLDDTTLVSRRWAMLEALSAAPDHRSEPRTMPADSGDPDALSPAAISSPGWS